MILTLKVDVSLRFNFSESALRIYLCIKWQSTDAELGSIVSSRLKNKRLLRKLKKNSGKPPCLSYGALLSVKFSATGSDGKIRHRL